MQAKLDKMPGCQLNSFQGTTSVQISSVGLFIIYFAITKVIFFIFETTNY